MKAKHDSSRSPPQLVYGDFTDDSERQAVLAHIAKEGELYNQACRADVIYRRTDITGPGSNKLRSVRTVANISELVRWVLRGKGGGRGSLVAAFSFFSRFPLFV